MVFSNTVGGKFQSGTEETNDDSRRTKTLKTSKKTKTKNRSQ